MAKIVISSLERDCIACPTIWRGETKEGKQVVVRYRWGDLSIRCSNSEPMINDEVFSQSIGDSFDGHMTLYELEDILEDTDITVDIELPTEFYGKFEPSDCEFVLFGNFINRLECVECDWKRDGESLEEFEYETVLPPECLSCGSKYDVIEKTPEHLKELQEKAEETNREDVVDNIRESVDDK